MKLNPCVLDISFRPVSEQAFDRVNIEQVLRERVHHSVASAELFFYKALDDFHNKEKRLRVAFHL